MPFAIRGHVFRLIRELFYFQTPKRLTVDWWAGITGCHVIGPAEST